MAASQKFPRRGVAPKPAITVGGTAVSLGTKASARKGSPPKGGKK